MTNKNTNTATEEIGEVFDPYQELVKEKAPELFCDACGHYPIEPVHGHFVCPACKMPTKCCEGGPMYA